MTTARMIEMATKKGGYFKFTDTVMFNDKPVFFSLAVQQRDCDTKTGELLAETANDFFNKVTRKLISRLEAETILAVQSEDNRA